MGTLLTKANQQGGEYFVSDIHGECAMFSRILKAPFGSIGQLHVVGDIYDRGPAPHDIMDLLAESPFVDIQWGNHDIVWMGASLGQRGCIAHVVRNCARYGNLDILTEAYGMDIAPLADFALSAYEDDPCEAFGLKVNPGLSPEELEMNVKIQKAMAILQFKVEAKHIDDNPSFMLEDRKQLHRIDYENATIDIDGICYELTDTYFPTVDRANPYELTDEEEAVMQHLEQEFKNCDKLQQHMAVFLEKGSLYKICDNKLLLHACVPLNEDGSLKEVEVFGTVCKGRALYDAMQEWVYKAFRSKSADERKRGQDMIWYLWLGQGSPLFAKSKMATFEIYLCRDKAARKEVKNSFYTLFDNPAVFDGIFADFGLDASTARIINGHVPVKVKDGEDPIKADGKVICIDGGMSTAYQKTTGIAGYTLVDNGESLILYALDALVSPDAELSYSTRVVE